ncbi:hypothetical protein RKD20_005392 [Streptomyces sp. SLBN-8D4]
MRGVVLVTGVMAAGKSTVAQALAERLPRAAHVRGDLFRRMIVSGREEYTPGASGEAVAQLRLRYRLSAATADAYAEAGFTAVVQDVVLSEDLTAYVGLVRTRPLYVVVLAPDAGTVAAPGDGPDEDGLRAGLDGRRAGRGVAGVDPADRAVAGHLRADPRADGGGDSRGAGTREGVLTSPWYGGVVSGGA